MKSSSSIWLLIDKADATSSFPFKRRGRTDGVPWGESLSAPKSTTSRMHAMQIQLQGTSSSSSYYQIATGLQTFWLSIGERWLKTRVKMEKDRWSSENLAHRHSDPLNGCRFCGAVAPMGRHVPGV